ncbi:MAG TPA: hypothetical protein PLD81_02465 [Elusimicrobiales bacterium]|nr:hypothetical protein [Elusimicrobiales bacterium]HPO94855.1 hypothetical protein [Elusimicrobiales bacterium]
MGFKIKENLKNLLKEFERKEFDLDDKNENILIKQIKIGASEIFRKIKYYDIKDELLTEYFTDFKKILKLLIDSRYEKAKKLVKDSRETIKLEIKTSKLNNGFAKNLKYDTIYREIDNMFFLISLIIEKLETEEK